MAGFVPVVDGVVVAVVAVDDDKGDVDNLVVVGDMEVEGVLVVVVVWHCVVDIVDNLVVAVVNDGHSEGEVVVSVVQPNSKKNVNINFRS